MDGVSFPSDLVYALTAAAARLSGIYHSIRRPRSQSKKVRFEWLNSHRCRKRATGSTYDNPKFYDVATQIPQCRGKTIFTQHLAHITVPLRTGSGKILWQSKMEFLR